MSFRKASKCRRCGLTTTYTNEVEFNLWQGRPGCPACSKTQKEAGGGDPISEQVEAPDSFAALAKWYHNEIEALQYLVGLGVVWSDEKAEIEADLRKAVRNMMGLEPDLE